MEPEFERGESLQGAEQRGLARAVEADDDQALAALDFEADVGEDALAAVALGEPGGVEHECRARAARGEADVHAAALAADDGHALLERGHAALQGVDLHDAGGAVFAQALGGALQADDLLLLLRLGLLQGGLEAGALPQVGAVGAARLLDLVAELIQPDDLVDVAVEELQVVRDDQQAATIGAQEVHQPAGGGRVEEVGRLVEQQQVGALEEQAGQGELGLLAAAEGADAAVEGDARQAEAGDELLGARIGVVVAEAVERGLRLSEALEGGVERRALGFGQHSGQGVVFLDGGVEAAAAEDVVAHGAVGNHGVLVGHILRQVAEGGRAQHGAAVGGLDAGDDLEQRGLAGAVDADEAGLLAGAERERDVVEHEPGPVRQRDVRNLQHGP